MLDCGKPPKTKACNPVPVSSAQTAIVEQQGSAEVSLSSAFELLLACCRSGGDRRISNESRDALQASSIWPEMIRLSLAHDTAPLLYRCLSEIPEAVPHSCLVDLRNAYLRNLQKNLRLTRELLLILDCLQVHQIPAIAYKGPVLAQALYGDVGLRQFSDLDVLVRSADLPRAKTAVAQLGYVPTNHMNSAEEHAYVASGYECTFDGPAGKNLLELQWRIVPRFYSVGFCLEDLFRRASTVTLCGKQIRTLSPEDLVPVIAVHAAKHAWVRLSYLTDFCAAIQTQTIDYHAVHRSARRLGIMRIVGVAFWLAHEMLGAPPPPEFQPELDSDPEIGILGSEIKKLLVKNSSYDPESPDYFRLMLRVRERRADRLRFLARLAFTPSVGEWSSIGLPSTLFPLYRVVRLVRLARKICTPRRTQNL